MTKPKTVDACFDQLEPPMRDVALALRARIEALGPGLSCKLAWGFPCWSGTERIFSIIAHSGHCNLQLWQGAQLTDISPRVEGTGKSLRHVKVRSLTEIDSALDTVIGKAIALDATAPQKVR